MYNQNKYTSQQIIQHLQDNNFHFSNDKVLRQPQKNREYINKAYYHLAQYFKTSELQQDAIIAQTIPIDKHIESASFIKRLRLLRKVSQTEFSLANLLKPDREKILKNFNLLMNSRTFIDRYKQKEGNLIHMDRQLEQIQTQKVAELRSLMNEEHSLRLKKQSEKAAFQEKIESIHNIENQILYKAKERNDLLEIQKELSSQFQRKKNGLQLAITKKKQLEIQLHIKNQQLINGTPQLKLAKIEVAQKIEKMKKQRDRNQSITMQKLAYNQNFQPECLQTYDEVSVKTNSLNQLIQIYENTVREKNHCSNMQNRLNQRIKQMKNSQLVKAAEISRLTTQISRTEYQKSEFKKKLALEAQQLDALRQQNEEQKKISEEMMLTLGKFKEGCQKLQNSIIKIRADFTHQYQQIRKVRQTMHKRNDEIQARMFRQFEEVLKQLSRPIKYEKNQQ